MINCNPETVSTDYDTSDRLYFEPLTAEDVLELIRRAVPSGNVTGVIVQFGGQTPLKLAECARGSGVPILGTSARRHRPGRRPRPLQGADRHARPEAARSGIARTPAKPVQVADGIGYPVVIRPSYVLGGRAMDDRRTTEPNRPLHRAAVRDARQAVRTRRLRPSGRSSSTAISPMPSKSTSIACADGKDTFVAGIMEHIEEAGIHSGDSACSLPPYSLGPEIIAELERQTRELALALGVVGLMNVQFAIKDGDVYILEVNPRAAAPCRSSPRSSACRSQRSPPRSWPARRWPRSRLKTPQCRSCRRQGSGVPVRPLP
jgi:carbamoyl-phosphate synthase large subunit